MKTIIQKPIIHINSEDLPSEMNADILGNNNDECHEIFDGNAAQLNDPIKIDVLRKYLDQLEEQGSNYVSIDFHTDHRELELDGMYIGIATQEEIDFHKQKDKDFQIKFTKERIKQYTDQLGLFQKKLQELSGD